MIGSNFDVERQERVYGPALYSMFLLTTISLMPANFAFISPYCEHIRNKPTVIYVMDLNYSGNPSLLVNVCQRRRLLLCLCFGSFQIVPIGENRSVFLKSVGESVGRKIRWPDQLDT